MKPLNRLAFRLSYLGLALAACVLGGCDAMQPPAAPIAWIIGLDVTDSINSERFLVMKQQMIPRLVLNKVRNRDTVHFVPIKDTSGDDVRVFEAAGPKHRLAQELAAWSQATVESATIRRTRATDIVGVVDYARRIYRLEQQSKSPRRLVMVIFTDGKIEGRQTALGSPIPGDLQIEFWGIDAGQEEALAQWSRQVLQLPDGQLRLVRYADWETAVEQFGQALGRRDTPATQRVAAK